MRRADIDLHGLARTTNSIVFQGTLLAGNDNLGLKGKTLQVLVDEGLISESSTASKNNPLSFSHMKVEMFHEKYNNFVKPKLLQHYNAKLTGFVTKLEKEKNKLKKNAFRSDRTRENCSSKILSLETKVIKTKNLNK